MIAYSIGWLATTLYLIAQGYISLNPNYKRTPFFVLNILAGVLLTGASIGMESYQAVAINAYWAIVSLAALFHLFTRFHFRMPIPWLWGICGLLAVASIAGILALGPAGPLIIDVIGWNGTIIYCGSYFLMAIRNISRISYLWVNAISGVMLLPAYAMADNWPSFVLNVVWVILSVIGAVRGERMAPPRKTVITPDPE